MPNSSFLVNVSELTVHDYETIIQSLITNVDQIWINALALEINSKDVQKKLLTLKEAGLIKIWDNEISTHSLSSTMIDDVLTIEQSKENAKVLNEFMHGIVSNDMEKSSDYTTFNIECSNMLSNYFTAKSLGADSIIQRNAVRTIISTGTKDFIQPYSECLFNITNIRSVSGLTIDEILKLRKYSVYFRNKIQEQIEKHLILGDIPPSLIKQDCEKLSKEYCKEINSRIMSSINDSYIGKGIALDIASIWIVPVTLFSISKKLWDAVFNREQRGFVMYLSTLQKSNNVP